MHRIGCKNETKTVKNIDIYYINLYNWFDTVEKFHDMDILDIIGCIGDGIEIGTRPVDANPSNLGRMKRIVN